MGQQPFAIHRLAKRTVICGGKRFVLDSISLLAKSLDGVPSKINSVSHITKTLSVSSATSGIS